MHFEYNIVTLETMLPLFSRVCCCCLLWVKSFVCLLFFLNYVLKDCILSLVWPLMSLSFISLIIRRLFDGYFLKYWKQKSLQIGFILRALLQYLSKLFRSLSFYLLLVQSLRSAKGESLVLLLFFFFPGHVLSRYLVEVEAFQSSYFSACISFPNFWSVYFLENLAPDFYS